ncbi:hypothetical protein EC957_002772 [Mortierella hygrophila]|uniref:25S rRNA adenine-N(1) methyltransferase n=1 Tax=Mortierella hygrophila TaxID=979708 RepID=A0A9P6F4E3_9FUNG|nr:hypothetical protein EC957_002772 [Mortierella hygrophila]
MAVKKPKRSTAKRRRIPVTASLPPATTPATTSQHSLTPAGSSSADSLSVLMALTPSGAETTSSTSSLLTIKSSKTVARKKSSMATAQLIRRYHTLNKELSQCLARIDTSTNSSQSGNGGGGEYQRSQGPRYTAQQKANDLARIAAIRQEMDDLGGLDMYQKASTLGQSKQRGGDSSKWFIPVIESCHPQLDKKAGKPLRLLDIGALSPHNYQKYSSWIKATPIDLNPQDPLITKMDFLEMPIPITKDDLFDIVCLSLVVNFVGDPTQRGEILRHSTRFLVPGTGLLYLVLPLPCIDNSRYMDHELLVEMMAALGYTTLVSHHLAKKLAYYAFRLDIAPSFSRDKGSKKAPKQPLFPKKMRHDKPNRNNFCIVLA